MDVEVLRGQVSFCRHVPNCLLEVEAAPTSSADTLFYQSAKRPLAAAIAERKLAGCSSRIEV